MGKVTEEPPDVSVSPYPSIKVQQKQILNISRIFYSIGAEAVIIKRTFPPKRAATLLKTNLS